MPDPLAPVVDSVFHGLFSTIDPLGMVLRTLMALLSDSLAQLVTGAYASLFATTTVDFSTEAVGSIWRITTGLSAALATVLLVVAAFRGMLAQSSRYVSQALPGVVVAILGPQAAALALPVVSSALTNLAETIVASATSDLAASMHLLAGVGSNPIYEGLGLLAPLIAATMLAGLSTVFFMLLFCMAAAVVLFVLSPFAFAGLVMGPTRGWFTRWATAMFAVLFAKVPIAILLALSVSLFADSKYAGATQSFVNAAAGMILGLGALLSPVLGYGLFSFMGTVATRPPTVPFSPGRGIGQAYYGTQMGKAAVNGTRSAVDRVRNPAASSASGTSTSPPGGPGPGAVVRPPRLGRGADEERAAQPNARTPSSGGSSAKGPKSRAGTAPGSGATTGSASRAATAGAKASGSTAATAGLAGAPTAGVGAAVVIGAAAAKQKATDAAKKGTTAVTSTADSLTTGSEAAPGGARRGRSPVGRGGAFGSPDHRRIDPRGTASSGGEST